ncbi:MAG TPA: hypothetical protein VHB25_08460 [Gemmatimonadaceae bacterium]|nr:hypothetical protein [Gemmatimonadaceae bacterium]
MPRDTQFMNRRAAPQAMTRSALAVEREQLERAIATARTGYDEQRLGARWADVAFRLECAERALLAHHPVGRAIPRAGSGAPPADLPLAARLTATPRRTTNSSPR